MEYQTDSKVCEPVLDFEKPVIELERKILDMRNFTSSENFEFKDEIKNLEKKLAKLKKQVYSSLTPTQRVQIARHPKRPYTLDYIEDLMDDFVEFHGDRNFADDSSIVAGMAEFKGRSVCVVGHQKGKNTHDNIKRNFGMPHPEGYRKALRVMQTAAKFKKPIMCFIDTPGAFPGIGAEERGQGEAIARNLREMALLPVPVIVTVIGEGASGGALGIGVGDRILMLENSWYCVISPEGCAAILWSDRAKAGQMSEVMKLTASDLESMGVVDRIVPEPMGGAHRSPQKMKEILGDHLSEELNSLSQIPVDELLEKRIKKYRNIGKIKVA